MTDPKFQAHQVRLDFAIRIVLGVGNGNRRPKRAEIVELLNHQLELARVAPLEDPIDDFFVESLPTRYGQFLIFSGGWEKAAIHTELLLEAFKELPDGVVKSKTWASALSLLRLSNPLVNRAGLKRGTIGEGNPGSPIVVPSDTRLSGPAHRVRFSYDELAALDIEVTDLEPFVFRDEDAGPILYNEPGNSPLEFRPLIRTKHGIVTAAPANVSTAVRALLIGTASKPAARL